MKANRLSKWSARMTFLGFFFAASIFGAHVLPDMGTYPVRSIATKTILVIDDTLEECVEWLNQSPQVPSRVDAIRFCRKGATVECMKMVYAEPKVYSRLKAAEICSDN